MLVDVVGVVALVVALPSLWLAYRADRQAKEVSRELLTVRRLTEGAESALREISSMAADQSVALEALDGQTASIADSVVVLQGVLQAGNEPEPDGDSDDDALARSVLMVPVSPSALDTDISEQIREVSGGADLSWALRRRGAGAPRWLVGTDDGRAWRATRWRGVNVRQAASGVEHALEPLPVSHLDQLEDAAGANDALNRMLDEGEAAEILLRRRSRGVPVYYVMTSHGRALRLVRTRWGWGGSPEIE